MLTRNRVFYFEFGRPHCSEKSKCQMMTPTMLTKFSNVGRLVVYVLDPEQL